MTGTELKKLIGDLLLLGFYKSKHENVSQLWSWTDGRPVFNKIMSRSWLQEIIRVMRFNDVEARRARRSPDKLKPIRKIFEMWNDTLLHAFVPGPNLTVGEQLLAFCDRYPFRQYIPSKPGKYSIKNMDCMRQCYKLCAEDGHLQRKEPQKPRSNNLGCKVVMHLAKPFKKSSSNIRCSNFFTLLKLGKKLPKDRLTLVGTIQKNRKSFLQNLLQQREERQRQHSTAYSQKP